MRGPTALLLVVSVAMCHALSKDEIEDFTDYLWKTSVLDQNLKDGSNVGNDEEEGVSDHAWEESGKFEGDLILNERQRRLIVEDVAEGLSRNGLKDSTKRWPNNEVIFYIQREHFSGDQVDAIKEGIDDLSRASCIKFRPYKKGDRDAVVIQGSRRGCFSQVGYQGGYQVLNLSGRHPVGRGCFRHGTVVHELLHTLGFYHMQSSHDRDDYIDVVWENIVRPARHNFRKYNAFSVSDFGVGYDYDSVLHYSRRAFSVNGRDTLVPKQSGAQIGQRVGLSDKDTQKLNKMYCDADSNSFDAEEQRPSKPIKTKKTRNEPFQGHGIGYHQGKTVIIKVPKAETFKLPDSPSYAVFDYFSKAPQALLPSLVQGLGVGKEIAYRPLASIFTPNKEAKTMKNLEITGNDKKTFQTKDTESKSHTAEAFFKSLADSKDIERKPIKEKPGNSASGHKDDSKVHEDLIESLERLDKIIRFHVYPSSKSSAISLSHFEKDYSNVLDPESKLHESKSNKIDELYSHSPNTIERKETKETTHNEDKNKAHNDTSNVRGLVFVSPLYNKIYDDVHSSFGISLPIKKQLTEKLRLSSTHITPDDEDDFEKKQPREKFKPTSIHMTPAGEDEFEKKQLREIFKPTSIHITPAGEDEFERKQLREKFKPTSIHITPPGEDEFEKKQLREKFKPTSIHMTPAGEDEFEKKQLREIFKPTSIHITPAGEDEFERKQLREKFKPTSIHITPDGEEEFEGIKNFDYSSFYEPQRKELAPKEPHNLRDSGLWEDNWHRDDYKKNNNLPDKKVGPQYGNSFNKLEKAGQESQEDEMLQNNKNYEDNYRLPATYEQKYNSNEDSSSKEYPYDDYAAKEKHNNCNENLKTRNEGHDPSEGYSEYKYPEFANSHEDEVHKYGLESKEYDYPSKKSDTNESSKEIYVSPKNHSARIVTTGKPLDYKKINEDMPHARYNYDMSGKGEHNLKPVKEMLHAASYQVTEEIDEIYKKNPSEDVAIVNSKPDDDYGSFDFEIEDRLAAILKNYDIIDNFDIKSPYDSSYEENSDDTSRQEDHNHASTTESTRYQGNLYHNRKKIKFL